jgi:hypothetical protein
MSEVASTSEKSVNLYQTAWCYNPEDSYLHTCHHEDLKIFTLHSLGTNKSMEIYITEINILHFELQKNMLPTT